MLGFLIIIALAVIAIYISKIVENIRDIRQISLQKLKEDNEKEQLRSLELDKREESLKKASEEFETEKKRFVSEKKKLYDSYYAERDNLRNRFQISVNNRAIDMLPELKAVLEDEKKAFEFVLNEYNSFFSNTTRKLLEGIEIGRLHNYFDNANDYYFTDFSVIVHNKQPKKNDTSPYKTTLTSCGCYDFRKRGVPACKHMLFLAYSLGILQIYREKNKNEFDRAMRKGTLYSNSDKKTDTKNQTSLSDKA